MPKAYEKQDCRTRILRSIPVGAPSDLLFGVPSGLKADVPRSHTSACDPKRTLMCIDPVRSSIDANSEIGNLQQSAVADPGSGKVSLGLTRRGRVAAGLIQFRQTVVRPAV